MNRSISLSSGALPRPRIVGAARRRLSHALVVPTLAVAAYLAALDMSIVNAILPVIGAAFQTDLSSIEWVATIYLLVQSTLLLAVGRFGDTWGHKPVYLLGLAIFIAGSILCGLSASAASLVASRAVQAAGAGMILANLAAIMTRIFLPEQRGRAVGIQATVIYLGLASGAPLGGWLADTLGWPSVFALNVPLGLFALALGWRVIPSERPVGRSEPFDWTGAAIYALGLALVLLSLNRGHVWGWTSAAVLAGLLIGGALVVAWALFEWRVASPMIDLRLFRQRTFATATASAFLNYMAVGSTFVLPFALIQGHGLSPAESGLMLTVQPIVMALTASVSGSLSDRIGTRAPATVGMLALSLGLYLLSTQQAATPLEVVVVGMLVTGLGIGLFTSPNSSAILGAVPLQRRGVANGVLGTVRTLGMVLGIAVAGAVYATALASAGSPGPEAIVGAADAALLLASGVALLGAVTSATRPRLDPPEAD